MPDHDPRLVGTKVCTRCGEDKPALAFPVDKKMRDGLKSECRECVAEISRKWRLRKATKRWEPGF